MHFQVCVNVKLYCTVYLQNTFFVVCFTRPKGFWKLYAKIKCQCHCLGYFESVMHMVTGSCFVEIICFKIWLGLDYLCEMQNLELHKMIVQWCMSPHRGIFISHAHMLSTSTSRESHSSYFTIHIYEIHRHCHLQACIDPCPLIDCCCRSRTLAICQLYVKNTVGRICKANYSLQKLPYI